LRWNERGNAGVKWHELVGAARLVVAVAGGRLILANRPELLAAIAARTNAPHAIAGGTYLAGYRHSREHPNFTRLTRLLEYRPEERSQTFDGNVPRPPAFLSENLSSLAGVFGRLTSAMLVENDRGVTVTQRVVYALR
jgi:hypothetical protein